MKKAFSALLFAAAITPALAGSGSSVTKVGGNDPAAPYCAWFLTQNEPAKKYGVSVRDPGKDQALIVINNARGGIPGPTFETGDPGVSGFNPTDCPAPAFTYVHTIAR